jgi:hypothetical protein
LDYKECCVQFIKKLFAFRDPARLGRERLRRESEQWTRRDPLIGAKVASREVVAAVLRALRSEGAVHFPSAVCAMGSLAGFACQESVRASAAAHGYALKDMAAEVMLPLMGVELSVWNLIAGSSLHSGCRCMSEPADVLAHCAASSGTPQGGVPRVAPEHQARQLPRHYVSHWWPLLQPIAAKHCPNPVQWPVLFALAVQQLVDAGKAEFDPCVAMQLAFEAAVPMACADVSFT